jgi:hypothetical protein
MNRGVSRRCMDLISLLLAVSGMVPFSQGARVEYGGAVASFESPRQVVQGSVLGEQISVYVYAPSYVRGFDNSGSTFYGALVEAGSTYSGWPLWAGDGEERSGFHLYPKASTTNSFSQNPSNYLKKRTAGAAHPCRQEITMSTRIHLTTARWVELGSLAG